MNFEYPAHYSPTTEVVACCFILWQLAIWVFLLALVVTFLR